MTSTTNTSSATGCGGEDAFVVAGEQRPIDAEREPDTRGRRAAERFDEAVVAAAAAEGVLRRVEGAALELEDGAAVVVEAAHQLRFDRERNVERPQAGEHRLEVRGGVVAVELGDLRRGGDVRLVDLALRVEHPERIAFERRPALLAQRVAALREVLAERVDVAARSSGSPRLLTISVTCCRPRRA